MILLTHVLDKAQQFVESLFTRQLPPHFTYHNLKHTQEVVEAAQLIGTRSNLSADDMEIVLLAAWLHDTGYSCKYDNHEDESIDIARKFLQEQQVPADKIEKVLGCILATKYPQQP